MRDFYLDASALVKRYAPELGTPLLNHLFAALPLQRLHVLNVGIAELVSAVARKRKLGLLSAAAAAQAMVMIGVEVVSPTGLQKVATGNQLIIDALPFIEPYSINGTDAIVLRSALDLAVNQRAAGNDLVLVASDQRLLKAAQAEGLTTFNPETQDQAALAALLGP